MCLADSLMVSGSDDGSVRVWDPAHRKCVRTLTGHQVCAYLEVTKKGGGGSGRLSVGCLLLAA